MTSLCRWDLLRPVHVRPGLGRQGREQTLLLPRFPSGPDVCFPCRGASGSRPIIQLLFNFVFKQYYQNRTSDGCTVLSVSS